MIVQQAGHLFRRPETAGMPEFGSRLSSLLLLSIAGAQDLLSRDGVARQHPRRASSQLVALVEDVDAAYAELAAKGVEFVREPVDRPWGMRTAHFRDPEGNIWEISRSLDSSTDAT